MVLEGGSITVDGAGTLVTTEQCLLHPNRNPDLTRAQIERTLRNELGVETIVWLPYGLALDDAPMVTSTTSPPTPDQDASSCRAATTTPRPTGCDAT